MIASPYAGDLVLVAPSRPSIRLRVNVLRLPSPVLYAVIPGFWVPGVYSPGGGAFDVGVATPGLPVSAGVRGQDPQL